MRVFAGVRVPDLLPVLPAAICLGHVRRNFEPHSEHRLAALGFKISRRLLAEIELNKKKLINAQKAEEKPFPFLQMRFTNARLTLSLFLWPHRQISLSPCLIW